MNSSVQQLLQKYDLHSENDYENAIKEIVQQIALLGLWRAKFFEHAAFYGGTALRIFYGLRRFSEDLDFSLIEKSDKFDLNSYIGSVEKELASFGFKVEVLNVQKNVITPIESAFIKGNTRKNLMYIQAPAEVVNKIPSNKKIKIKFEVDTDPPPNAEFEVKILLNPLPFAVRIFTQPSLFAGKLHAILFRNWINRVKGRDYYDFVWFVSQNIPCHVNHLKARIVQSGHFKQDQKLDLDILKNMLIEHFNKVDFIQAKDDILPFIKDQHELDLWGKDFFISLVERLQIAG